MPGRHASIQVRSCAMPSTVARHSKQMPMPQTGHRRSPETDRRKPPAITIALATEVPGLTAISLSSMRTLMGSRMMGYRRKAHGQKWFERDFRLAPEGRVNE